MGGPARARGMAAPSQLKGLRGGVPRYVAQAIPQTCQPPADLRRDCGKGLFMDGNQLISSDINMKTGGLLLATKWNHQSQK
jgi:hypothetical protein